MEKIKKILTISSLIFFTLTSLFIVSAYNNVNYNNQDMINQEKHELMENAFQREDYELWFNTMSQYSPEKKILTKINSENFHLFVDLREARMNENENLVNELKEELNLKQNSNQEKNMNKGKGQRNLNQKENCLK